MEDVTALSAVSQAAAPADTLTPAARLIVSLLPDPRGGVPARRENFLIRSFAGWVRRWHGHLS
jgi:hypothetical protein